MHALTPPTRPPFDFSLVDALCIWAHANLPKERYSKLADKHPNSPYVLRAAVTMYRECAAANPAWDAEVRLARPLEVYDLVGGKFDRVAAMFSLPSPRGDGDGGRGVA